MRRVTDFSWGGGDYVPNRKVIWQRVTGCKQTTEARGFLVDVGRQNGK